MELQGPVHMYAGLCAGLIFVGYVVSNLVIKKMHYRIITILFKTVGNEKYFVSNDSRDIKL